MMDTRMSVCRRRSFKKHKRGTSLPFINATMEQIILVPFFQHLFIDTKEVKSVTFGKLHFYILLYFII